VFMTYTGPDAQVLHSSVTRPVGTIAFGYRLVRTVCMVRSGVVSGNGPSTVQNLVGLYAAEHGLLPRRGSIHEPGRLPTTVGRTQSDNHSTERHNPRAHNCGYRDDLRPGASDTGDTAALACQQSDRFTHV